MPTFVMRKGVIVPIEEAEPLIQMFGTGPAVISDTMPATRNMCDGKHYTSKAEFRQVTKAHGCIEVGTDTTQLKPRKKVPLDRRKRREDIKRVIHNLKNGVKTGE
jgi:hypothetical protein